MTLWHSAMLILQIIDNPDLPKYVTAEEVGYDNLALTRKAPVWDRGSNMQPQVHMEMDV